MRGSTNLSIFNKIITYLGWCPSKKSASNFQIIKDLKIHSPITQLHRKLRITIVILFALAVLFPFARPYESEEELVETLEINTTLSDGASLSEIWNLKGINIIRTNISSSDEVLVHLIDKKALKGQEYKGLLAKLSDVHEYDYQANITNVMEVKILSPAWRGDGSAVEISGSIKAYRITKNVWLPWWWP
jgi:hypothetical protein